MMDDDRLVTVCAACSRASCWQAKHMCDRSDNADTKQLTVRELKRLDLENPSYWSEECERGEA